MNVNEAKFIGHEQAKGDNPDVPIPNTPVTLIGHDTLEGHLTGRSKTGRRCPYWQVYWTKHDTQSDNTCQWIPQDQIKER